MREPTKEDIDAAASLLFEICAPGCVWEDEPDILSSCPNFETKGALRAVMGAVLSAHYNRQLQS